MRLSLNVVKLCCSCVMSECCEILLLLLLLVYSAYVLFWISVFVFPVFIVLCDSFHELNRDLILCFLPRDYNANELYITLVQLTIKCHFKIVILT